MNESPAHGKLEYLAIQSAYDHKALFAKESRKVRNLNISMASFRISYSLQ